MSSASFPELLACPLCGHVHRRPSLAHGQRAECVRCGATLTERARFGNDTALAFALTGAFLAAPALLLPFIRVAKFGAMRESFALSGASALWEAHMRLTAIWVLFCGGLVPLLLLGTLLGLLLPRRLGWPTAGAAALQHVARALEQWAMPEVQVLAVGVALAKLGSVVEVRLGPGLWCYTAMAVCLLVAWHTFELDHRLPAHQHPAAIPA